MPQTGTQSPKIIPKPTGLPYLCRTFLSRNSKLPRCVTLTRTKNLPNPLPISRKKQFKVSLAAPLMWFRPAVTNNNHIYILTAAQTHYKCSHPNSSPRTDTFTDLYKHTVELLTVHPHWSRPDSGRPRLRRSPYSLAAVSRLLKLLKASLGTRKGHKTTLTNPNGAYKF